MPNQPLDDLWAGQVPRSTRQLGLITSVTVLGLLGGFAGWSLTAPIESASLAPGHFVALGNNRSVQHLEGGTVTELAVAEGDLVSAGQVLVQIDGSEVVAEIGQLRREAFRLEIAEARLHAEIAGAQVFNVPGKLRQQASSDPHLQRVVDTQRALFAARRQSLDSELAILAQGVSAYQEHIAGARRQLEATTAQLQLIAEERDTNERLLEKGLSRRPNYLAAKRAEAELEGEIATQQAHIADGMERIVRGERLMAKARHDAIERALGEIDTVQSQARDVAQKLAAAERRRQRLSVRAPVDGVVVRLEVNTEGAVIAPGDTLLELVPASDGLVIEAQIRPQDIEAVSLGQRATVRLTAFNQRTTPVVSGEVIYVSADTLRERDRPGAEAYLARVRLDPAAIAPGITEALTPGMPVEVYIKTGARTFADYLLQPLTDSMSRAFRES